MAEIKLSQLEIHFILGLISEYETGGRKGSDYIMDEVGTPLRNKLEQVKERKS